VRHYAENVRLLSGLPYSTHDATDYGAGLLYLVMNELDGRSIMYPAAPFRLGLDRGPRRQWRGLHVRSMSQRSEEGTILAPADQMEDHVGFIFRDFFGLNRP
jgi:hypothetical protein